MQLQGIIRSALCSVLFAKTCPYKGIKEIFGDTSPFVHVGKGKRLFQDVFAPGTFFPRTLHLKEMKNKTLKGMASTPLRNTL